jgi:ABC-type transporter Mla maintaining outer membrane lipid asymmetry permease subunit MlaE
MMRKLGGIVAAVALAGLLAAPATAQLESRFRPTTP